MRRSLPLFVFLVLAVSRLWADSPAFDLTGPKVDVHVKRGEVTLPIEPGSQSASRRSSVDPSRFPRKPVGALHPGRRLPARSHQSPAGRLVHPRGNLDARTAQRGRLCHRAAGGAAGADFPGARDRRRLQHPAQGGARSPRRLCARHPGSAGCQLGPDAAGRLSERSPGHLADRSEGAERTRRDGGALAWNPGRPAVLR